jgi:DNA transposition AAA+ family ATPase
MVTPNTTAAPRIEAPHKVISTLVDQDPDIVPKPGTHFRITGHHVKDAIKDLPGDQQDAIWWFFVYCKEHNFRSRELSALLRKPGSKDFYSADSITALWNGGRIRRGENIMPMIESIRSFREIEEARDQQKTSGFIETRLFNLIETRCMKALLRQKILYIFGDSQIGKTTCLMEVQRRHNHGQTIYVEVPTGGAIGPFFQKLAKKLKIPENGSTKDMREAIISMFTSRMLLIVDEAHRCLTARSKPGGNGVLDFLRELWNEAKCGIVISMTNEGRDIFQHGRNAKSYEQLWRRRITPLQLPNVTPADDLELFAAAYGLPPATDTPEKIKLTFINEQGAEETRIHEQSPLRLQETVNRDEGLGVWITILQDASDIAAEQRRPMSWKAVIKAHAQAMADAEIYQ